MGLFGSLKRSKGRAAQPAPRAHGAAATPHYGRQRGGDHGDHGDHGSYGSDADIASTEDHVVL
ncbi:hypothetical protein IWQ57_006763, partial [Coemansia nantahalensis]